MSLNSAAWAGAALLRQSSTNAPDDGVTWLAADLSEPGTRRTHCFRDRAVGSDPSRRSCRGDRVSRRRSSDPTRESRGNGRASRGGDASAEWRGSWSAARCWRSPLRVTSRPSPLRRTARRGGRHRCTPRCSTGSSDAGGDPSAVVRLRARAGGQAHPARDLARPPWSVARARVRRPPDRLRLFARTSREPMSRR